MGILIVCSVTSIASASEELESQFQKNTKLLQQASFDLRKILNATEKAQKICKIQPVLTGINSALTVHEYSLLLLESKKYANPTGAYNKYLHKALDYSKKKIQSALIQVRSSHSKINDQSVRNKGDKALTAIADSLGIIDTMLKDIEARQ
jgi:hypothetical protein